MPDNLPQGPAEFLRQQAELQTQQTQQLRQEVKKSLQTLPPTRRVQTGRSGFSKTAPSSGVPASIKNALLAETKTQKAINAPYYKGELEKVQAGLALSPENQKKFKINAEYSDLNSKEKQDRITQLKSPTVNPLILPSAYDGLTAAYHKWTSIAAGAQRDKVSGEMQERLANNYYDRMLVPLYQKLGATPISRQLWQREAFQQEGAMTFDIDDAYMNSGMRGIVRGLANTIQMVENAAETGTNLLGHSLKEGWASTELLAKDIAKDPLGGLPKDWIDHVNKVINNDESIFETAKRDTRSIPILKGISKAFDDRAMQFWTDSIPAKDNTEAATSFATEMVAQAPLFKVLGAVNEAGIVATGLTDALAKVPAGKFIAKTLMAGTEGSLFGVATRPQEDKHKWIEDGISFIAMSTLFAGLGKAGSFWLNRFKESGGYDKLGERASEFKDRFQKKVRPLNDAEKDQETIVAKASQMAVGGSMTADAIDQQGLTLAHDWAEKGLNARQQRNEISKLTRADAVKNAPVIKAAKDIQRIIGKKSIVDIVNDPIELKKLMGQLAVIRDDASKTLTENVPEIKAAAVQKTAKEARTPGAARTREKIRQDLVAKHPDIAQAMASGNITKEEFERRVDQEFARQSVEGGVEGSKKARKIRDAVSDAENIGKKRTAIQESRAKVAGKAVATATKGLKSEIARPEPTAGEETRAAFGGGATSGLMHKRAIDMAWKNFSDALKPFFEKESKKGGYDKNFNTFIREHVDGMEEHDFSEFLHFFLPIEMGPYQRDIFFEKGKAGENPNLMAFLTNYKAMLPTAINTEIKKRLAETVKVNLSLPKDEPLTARAERFYARIVYNHVDNLLGSVNVRQLGERNVYKSTARETREQTEWMAESIGDRLDQDREDLQTMFSKHPEQMQTAVSALENMYETLYHLNDEVFDGSIDPAKAEKWKKASDNIADWMIEQSNLPESKLRLDKWSIDYRNTGSYKWQRP